MAGSEFHDYYKELKITSDAAEAEIRTAYLHMAKKYHPDMGGSPAQMKKINEAYSILKDNSLRAEYDAIYLRYHEWVDGDREDDNLINEVEAELALIRQARQMAKQAALGGAAWFIIGSVITGVTYAVAKPGSTYFVAWGAMLIGAYQLLKGLYYFFNPHALIKKSLGDQTPENFRKKGQGARSILKVAAIGIVTLLIIGAILGNGSATPTTPVSDQQSSGSQIPSDISDLKSQYDTCVSDAQTLKSQLDDINSQMDNYQSFGNTTAYNTLVPQQNEVANSYNSKRDECENLRTQYNQKVDSHNSSL